MIAPIKAAGLRSYGFHTDHWNPGTVITEFAQHFRCNQLFSFSAAMLSCRPVRPKHKNERIRFGPADRIHQRLFGLYKPGMRDVKVRNRSSRESESSGFRDGLAAIRKSPYTAFASGWPTGDGSRRRTSRLTTFQAAIWIGESPETNYGAVVSD